MSEPYNIAALDIASTMGVAHGRVGERPQFMSKSFHTDSNDISGHVEVCAKAQIWAIDYLNVVQPDFLVIEAPLEVVGRGNPHTTIRLTSLVTTIGSVARNKQYPVRFGRVSTVRSALLGRGNGTLPGDFAKREVMRFCLAAGWEPKTNDQSDAGAVWWWLGNLLQPHLAQPMDPLSLGISAVQRPVKARRMA